MTSRMWSRLTRVRPGTAIKVLIAVGVAMLLVLNILTWRATRDAEVADAERDATAQQAQTLAEQVKAKCAEGGETAEELGDICPDARRIAASPTATVAKGERGERGPGPTVEQVESAVAVYCSTRGQCRGPAGAGPSPAQVAAAVREYCNDRGECRGEQGVPGDPPTDDQVLAAVSTYCAANNGCRGPQGERGETGPPGATGPPGYPRSFTFTHMGVTYRCTDADGDREYTCRPTETSTPRPS